jgi:putative cell wall-binding protein
VATGANYADALAISPYSWATHSPVFLSSPTGGLSASTLQALREGGFTHVVITGGTSAVPASVERQLAAAGLGTERVSGANRYETAAAVASWSVEHSAGLLGYDGLAVATGQNYPDALAGGAFAGVTGTVLVLSDSTTTGLHALTAVLGAHKDEIGHINALGGTAVLSDSLLARLGAAYR